MNEFIDQNSFSSGNSGFLSLFLNFISESTSEEYMKMDAIISSDKINRTPDAFKRVLGSNSSTPLHRSLLEQKVVYFILCQSVELEFRFMQTKARH